jgi:hypothetical protein
MTAQHDLDRQLSAFLTEGPTRLPDASFDAVRDRTEQTRQRVVLGPWRFPEMNKLLAIGLGAAAVVAALLVGPNLLPSSGSGPGAPPSGSVGPTAMAPSTEPSEAPPSAEPTASSRAFLPVGSYTIVDSGDPDAAVEITVPIATSGWTALQAFGGLQKGWDADPPEAAMLLWSWPAGSGFNVFGDPCEWQSTIPETPYTTVDEIAAALAAQASRDASDPVDVTIGGYDGKQVTLHVPVDVSDDECDGGTFASYGIEGHGEGVDGLARTHQGPGQIDELSILDVNGSIVIIDAMYRPDTSDELIEEMRAIAESATFE